MQKDQYKRSQTSQKKTSTSKTTKLKLQHKNKLSNKSEAQIFYLVFGK